MKILLVKPSWKLESAQVRYANKVKFPAISLGIIAALSKGHDVRIVDSDWDRMPWKEDFDLVAVTSTTFTSQRAYAITRHFRNRGAKTVLGGIHPTVMPEECLEHADAVVIGEAEYTWPRILEDAARGKLQERYQAETPTDMADVPFADRKLMNEESWFTAVEATRGCPNKCRYCYLPSTPWREHRSRPIGNVVEEISRLKQGIFIFVDENLFTDRDYAMALFKELKFLKKNWLVQAPTTIADDDELLDAMAESGCFNAQIGFQSFNPTSLEHAAVHHNRVDDYAAFVRKLHDRNIVVTGFFVFGFDTDKPQIFDHTVKMIKHLDVDDVGLFIHTPFPGSYFYDKYKTEGRLRTEIDSRDRFAWQSAIYHPKLMSAQQLEYGVQKAYSDLYPFLMKNFLRVAGTHLPLVAKNPKLLKIFLAGALRKPHL